VYWVPILPSTILSYVVNIVTRISFSVATGFAGTGILSPAQGSSASHDSYYTYSIIIFGIFVIFYISMRTINIIVRIIKLHNTIIVLPYLFDADLALVTLLDHPRWALCYSINANAQTAAAFHVLCDNKG
jgi:hypothetical protein